MPTNHDKVFTATDVMALQEHLGKRIDVIGEQYKTLQTDISFVKEKVKKLDTLEYEINLIKVDMRDKKADKKEVHEVKERVSILERKFVPAM